MFLSACGKDDPVCWECYVISINNVTFFCEDPEKIETGEPENVQMICDERELEQYRTDHSPVTTSVEKNCDGNIFFPVITRSAVCTEVK